ncbi:MAG: glycosyltransferase [Chloroflexota bacterium]
MRILYALDSYRPNIDGVAISHERIAKRLAKRGHSVAVVAPARRLSDYAEDVAGLLVYRVRALKVLSDRWWLPVFPSASVERALLDYRPDLVVISLPFLLSRAALSVAHRHGVPVVGVTGTMAEWLTANLPLPRDVAARAEPAVWRQIASYYERCDVVVGVTQTALDLLRAHGLTRPSMVISNGVSLRRFHPRRRDRDLAARLGLDERPTVMYTGRLDAEKELDVWLRAAATVRQRGIDAQFILVGQGSERHRLEGLAESLGLTDHVRFAGFLSDRDYESVFSLADVFAIASTAELQSIVTLEAAASGLPLVVVNAGALPELVREGYNGALFTPRDHEEMATQLVSVLGDPALRREWARHSRLVALQHDIEASVAAYERLYRAVAASTAPVPVAS